MVVLTEGQPGIDEALLAGPTEFLQPGRFHPRPWCVAHVHQRRSPPPLQCRHEDPARQFGPPLCERPLRRVRLTLEAQGVDIFVVDHEDVPARSPDDPIPADHLTEQ